MYRYLLLLVYKVTSHLPRSTYPILGWVSKQLRGWICYCIFKDCGSGVNIDRRVRFGDGRDIVIGNNSGIGRYSSIPNNTTIGADVMIGPRLTIVAGQHNYDRLDIPMRLQGSCVKRGVVIGDDVWIGEGVFINPGVNIGKGSIIAARSVVVSDVPKFSVVGGNPAAIIKSRL